MKIRRSLISGFKRALKAWKGVLIMWLVSFVPATLFMIPLRSVFRTGFENSMLAGKFAGGFDLDAFLDLGPVLKPLLSSMASGFVLVLSVSVTLNAFITAGLFDALRNEKAKFSAAGFFAAGAGNFWPFLLVTLAIPFVLIIISVVVAGTGAGIIAGSETMPERSSFMIRIISLAVILLLVPVFIIAADFARAGKTASREMTAIGAIGFGLSQAVSQFRSAYPMMLILLLFQLVPAALAFCVMPAWRPVSGNGVSLVLLTSQLVLLLRFFLRTWRYGSVAAMLDGTAGKRRTGI